MFLRVKGSRLSRGAFEFSLPVPFVWFIVMLEASSHPSVKFGNGPADTEVAAGTAFLFLTSLFDFPTSPEVSSVPWMQVCRNTRRLALVLPRSLFTTRSCFMPLARGNPLRTVSTELLVVLGVEDMYHRRAHLDVAPAAVASPAESVRKALK